MKSRAIIIASVLAIAMMLGTTIAVLNHETRPVNGVTREPTQEVVAPEETPTDVVETPDVAAPTEPETDELPENVTRLEDGSYRVEHRYTPEDTNGLDITQEDLPAMADTPEGREAQIDELPADILFKMGYTEEEVNAHKAKIISADVADSNDVDEGFYDPERDLEYPKEMYWTTSKHGINFLDTLIPYFYDADAFCDDHMSDWTLENGEIADYLEFGEKDPNNEDYWLWVIPGLGRHVWYDMSPYKIDEATFRVKYDKLDPNYVGYKE